jgi:hypothetical protein
MGEKQVNYQPQKRRVAAGLDELPKILAAK